MKKLLIATMLIAGIFASVGTASALDYSSGYPDWATEAVNTGEING